jgi:hypothetical protein
MLLGLLFTTGAICFRSSGAELPRPQARQEGISVHKDSASLPPAANWEEVLEEMAEQELEVENWGEILSGLAAEPIPINTADRETLESIPFLSPEQVEHLSYYVYRYGPIVHLSEILLVEGMDTQTLRWLKPFIRLDVVAPDRTESTSFRNILQQAHHRFESTFSKCLEQKMGYSARCDSSDRYAGNALNMHVRYLFKASPHWEAGISLGKEAGERLWSNGYGIDHMGYFLVFNGDKRLRKALIGDYRVQLGQGLVCGSGFLLSKQLGNATLERTGATLSRQFSGGSSGSFRGVAAEWLLKKAHTDARQLMEKMSVRLVTFGSLKAEDARVSNDTFQTIYTTGLHRTKSEIASRSALKVRTVAGHLRLEWTGVQVGLTTCHWWMNAVQQAEASFWKPHPAAITNGWNSALDVRARLQQWIVFGEMATDGLQNQAVLVGCSGKATQHLSVGTLLRSYDRSYNAPYAKSFTEGSTPQNEQGIYTSGTWDCLPYLRLGAYYDLFRFPWLTARSHAPSGGYEQALQLEWERGKSRVTLTYKKERKQSDQASAVAAIPSLVEVLKEQIKGQAQRAWEYGTLKTTFAYHRTQTGKDRSYGIGLCQDISFSASPKKWSLNGHLVLYRTDSYENRLYFYEKGLPGSFGMPPLSGCGLRQCLSASWKSDRFEIHLKLSQTHAVGATSMGQGSEQLQGDRRTEGQILFRVKFGERAPQKSVPLPG